MSKRRLPEAQNDSDSLRGSGLDSANRSSGDRSHSAKHALRGDRRPSLGIKYKAAIFLGASLSNQGWTGKPLWPWPPTPPPGLLPGNLPCRKFSQSEGTETCGLCENQAAASCCPAPPSTGQTQCPLRREAQRTGDRASGQRGHIGRGPLAPARGEPPQWPL